MANAFDVLEGMRRRTQLVASHREDFGGLRLSSKELGHLSTPVLQPSSHESLLTAKCGLPGSVMSYACEAGEPCPATTGGDARFAALPNSATLIKTSQGDWSVAQQWTARAPVVSPSRLDPSISGHQPLAGLPPPGSRNGSTSVAPAPTHGHGVAGSLSSSGSGSSMQGGEQRSPFGSTAVSGGWCLASSQPPTAGQGDHPKKSSLFQGTSAPNGHPSIQPSGNGDSAAPWPSTCRLGNSQPGDALLQQQQQQYQRQQRRRVATHDGSLQEQQHQEQQYRSPPQQQQQKPCNTQRAHTLGPVDWQRQQQTTPVQQRGLLFPQQLQHEQQMEMHGTQQQQQTQPIPKFSAQVQTQGNQMCGDLQGTLRPGDTSLGVHRQPGTQPAGYATGLGQQQQHFLQQQQQHQAAVSQPLSGGAQLATACGPQQDPRFPMLQLLDSQPRHLPLVDQSPSGAHLSSLQSLSQLLQPEQQQQEQPQSFRTASAQLLSHNGRMAARGVNECTNGTSSADALLAACQQPLPMASGLQRQQGARLLPSEQGQEMRSGPQQYPGSQLQQSMAGLQGPQPQADAHALMARPGQQGMQMQPWPHAAQAQPGQQGQSGEQGIRLQAGLQGPETAEHGQHRCEPTLCQQPHQHVDQQEQACHASNKLASQQTQAQCVAQELSWGQQPQSDITEEWTQVQQRRMQQQLQQQRRDPLPQQTPTPASPRCTVLQQRQPQEQQLQQQQQLQWPLQQMQLQKEQQRREEEEERQRQEDQRQLQQLLMPELDGFEDWQQDQQQLQTQSTSQPGTVNNWPAPLQACPQSIQAYGGGGMTAQRQHLVPEQALQELSVQRTPARQALQGYPGTLPKDSQLLGNERGLGQQVFPYQMQSQTLSSLDQQTRVQVQDLPRQPEETSHGQRVTELQLQQQAKAQSQQDGVSWPSAAAGPPTGQQHSLVAGSSLLQPGPALSASGGQLRASPQDSFQGLAAFTKTQPARLEEPRFAGPPLSSSASRQQSTCLSSPSGIASQSLVPSAPVGTSSGPTAMAASSGSGLSHLQQQPWAGVMSSIRQQQQQQPMEMQYKPRYNSETAQMSAGLSRVTKFSSTTPESQLELLQQQQQHRLLPSQPPPQLHEAMFVNPASHNGQQVPQHRSRTDVHIQPPTLDCQLQSQQQQHQLSGQDSCTTPDGAGQEEVEAVPHGRAVARVATPPNAHAGAALLRRGAEALPQQQQKGQGRPGLPESVSPQQQHGQWPQPQQQRLQHGQAQGRDAQQRPEEGLNVSPSHALSSEALCIRQAQGQDQLQCCTGQLMQQQIGQMQSLQQQPHNLSASQHMREEQQPHSTLLAGPHMHGQQQQQQQLKPGQLTLPSRTSAKPTELLLGRPLLPLFTPVQDNGHYASGDQVKPCQQQQQQQQQQLMLLAVLGGLSSANASQQQPMGTGAVTAESKNAMGTHCSVLARHPTQQLHQIGQAPTLLQQQQQPEVMRTTTQMAAAQAHPAALGAAPGTTAAAVSNRTFNTYVDPPLLATQDSGLLLPQEQQRLQLQQHHQWQVLQQHHLLQQQKQRQQQQQQQEEVRHLTAQSGQQGPYSACAAPQWAFQHAESFGLGVGPGGASAGSSAAAGGAVAPGTLCGLPLGQVRAEVMRSWRSGEGQVQQQQLNLDQEHMAPRPQLSSSTPMPPQQQQQHINGNQNQHHYPQQQDRGLLQQQQKLQDQAANALPGTAPLSFDWRSWASGSSAMAPGTMAAPASGVGCVPAASSLVSGQVPSQLPTAPWTSSALPATTMLAGASPAAWLVQGGAWGGAGSSGSNSNNGGAVSLEPPYKRTKREGGAVALQSQSKAAPTASLLGDPTGKNSLGDAGKAAVAAAIEAMDRLVAPIHGLRRNSGSWAPPLVLSPAPGYESSSETNSNSVRKAAAPKAFYGHYRHQQQQPLNSLLLEQQHHLELRQQLLNQQQQQQQRRRSQPGGKRSQGSSNGGAVVTAPAAMPFPAPLPRSELMPPAPGASANASDTPAVQGGCQWGSEDSFPRAPAAVPLQPPRSAAGTVATTATATPPLRRQVPSTPQKATVAASGPPPAEEGCARSRPIDLSKLGQHRLKPPPIIHPLRPGSRLPLVAAGLRVSAVGLPGGAAALASPIGTGASQTEDANALDGALVPHGAAAASTGGSAAATGKRLPVKDRRVAVELLPVVGKAVGAGAGGVRLRGGAGGRGGGDGQAAATGKLLNALRDAKAIMSRRFVVRRSGIAQLGVFAAERIPADTLLMEYHGEAVRTSVADLREKRYSAAGLGCYLFNPGGLPDEAVVLDATHRGNIMRFVNHSCGPNCVSRTVVIEGQRRIFLFSLHELHPGTELTYDYKLSSALCMDAFKGLPEEYIEQAAAQIGTVLLRCQCGHERCRTYL